MIFLPLYVSLKRFVESAHVEHAPQVLEHMADTPSSLHLCTVALFPTQVQSLEMYLSFQVSLNLTVESSQDEEVVDEVGDAVGDAVGVVAATGDAVGLWVGLAVGLTVGLAVGESVGAGVSVPSSTQSSGNVKVSESTTSELDKEPE